MGSGCIFFSPPAPFSSRTARAGCCMPPSIRAFSFSILSLPLFLRLQHRLLLPSNSSRTHSSHPPFNFEHELSTYCMPSTEFTSSLLPRAPCLPHLALQPSSPATVPFVLHYLPAVQSSSTQPPTHSLASWHISRPCFYLSIFFSQFFPSYPNRDNSYPLLPIGMYLFPC